MTARRPTWVPPAGRTLGGSRGGRGGATQAALLATMARGLAAQAPLRLGQPLGAFPELAGGRGGGGAALCSTRTFLPMVSDCRRGAMPWHVGVWSGSLSLQARGTQMRCLATRDPEENACRN